MSDYTCEHGKMAMGRDCEQCRQQRLAVAQVNDVASRCADDIQYWKDQVEPTRIRNGDLCRALRTLLGSGWGWQASPGEKYWQSPWISDAQYREACAILDGQPPAEPTKTVRVKMPVVHKRWMNPEDREQTEMVPLLPLLAALKAAGVEVEP